MNVIVGNGQDGCTNICANNNKFIISSGINQTCGIVGCSNLPPENQNDVFNDSGPYRIRSFLEKIGKGKILPEITYKNEKKCNNTFTITKAVPVVPYDFDWNKIQMHQKRQMEKMRSSNGSSIK